MPDGLSINWHMGDLTRGLKELEKRVDRATMWGLREVGRKLSREARRRAPVYTGADARAEKGRLRRSIKSSRRLKRFGRATYGLTVGPRGDVVFKYAQKVEEQARFMHEAYAAISPEIPAIFNRGWSRAMRKR